MIKNVKSMLMVSTLVACNLFTVDVFADSDNKYETYKLDNVKKFKLDNNEYVPPEVIKDIKAQENMSYLKNKTESKFEIAISNTNGGYSFVKSSDNLDDAIKEVKSLKNTDISNGTPVIIDENGVVVYATDSIGRLTRLVNGKPSSDRRYNVNIYSSSTSTNALTYVNHGYMDDMPIIDQTSKRVKVEVNGVIGWIDKQEKDSNGNTITHVVQVPLNKATNLSYYKRSGNDLLHYMSSDVSNSSAGGYSSTIGKAPSFMKENTKYYSYDGNFFYTDIEKLVLDSENGNHKNAVNASDEFHNYYLYLPGRTKTSYTAKDITNYLNNNTPSNSILKNKGAEFIQAQEKYGVNASFIVGIAMNESGKGTSSIAKDKNNIFGLNAVDANPGQSANYFASIEDCVNEFASHWMSRGYFNPSDWRYGGSSLGNKGFGVNIRYASDPYWGEKAASYMYGMDKYISGSTLREHNKYDLGIYKANSNVTNSNGTVLYTSTKGYVTPILYTSGSYYKINSDRQTTSKPENGNYSWTNEGKVSTSSVTKINSSYSGALNQSQINVINKFEQVYIYGPLTKPTIDLSNSNNLIKKSLDATNILKKVVDGKKYDRQRYLDAWTSLSTSEKEVSQMQEVKKQYTKLMSISEAAEATLRFYEDVKESSDSIIKNSVLATKLNSKSNMNLGARGAAYKEYNEATKHGENSKNSQRMNYLNTKYVDTINFLEVVEFLGKNDKSSAITEASKIKDSTLKSEAQRAIKIFEDQQYTSNQRNVINKFKQFYIYGPMDNPKIDLSNKNDLITKSSDATNILKKVVDGKKYDRQIYLDAWNKLSSKEKSHEDMQEIKTNYLRMISISEAAQAGLAFYENVVKNIDNLISDNSLVISLNSKDNKVLGARGAAHKEYNEATKHGENSKNSLRMNYINQKYLDTVNFLDGLNYLNKGDIENAKLKANKIKDSKLSEVISVQINK